MTTDRSVALGNYLPGIPKAAKPGEGRKTKVMEYDMSSFIRQCLEGDESLPRGACLPYKCAQPSFLVGGIAPHLRRRVRGFPGIDRPEGLDQRAQPGPGGATFLARLERSRSRWRSGIELRPTAPPPDVVRTKPEQKATDVRVCGDLRDCLAAMFCDADLARDTAIAKARVACPWPSMAPRRIFL